MNLIIELSWLQMVSAFLLVGVLLIIISRLKINREMDLIIATMRMTVQLTITGFVLVYIIKNPHPLITLLIIALMETFAVRNVYKRVKRNLSKELKKIIAISLVAGTSLTILYFIFIIVRVTPWYNPQYFIPLSGMLIGNSMTGVALGVTKLIDGMHDQKHLVENALMLGATPKRACRDIVNRTFDSAILPTINSMVGMGIISLPGMMTGQILSGTSPLTAISYQIAIMIGIACSVALTCVIFVKWAYRSFFNESDQLVIDFDSNS